MEKQIYRYKSYFTGLFRQIGSQSNQGLIGSVRLLGICKLKQVATVETKLHTFVHRFQETEMTEI